MKNLTLGWCLLLAAPAALAQAGAAEVERGRLLYMQNACFSCHGTVGQGGDRGAGPRIAPEPYPLAAFTVLVRKPREAMPRYEERFINDEQLRLIHGYLASIAKGPGAKDIAVLRSMQP